MPLFRMIGKKRRNIMRLLIAKFKIMPDINNRQNISYLLLSLNDASILYETKILSKYHLLNCVEQINIDLPHSLPDPVYQCNFRECVENQLNLQKK